MTNKPARLCTDSKTYMLTNLVGGSKYVLKNIFQQYYNVIAYLL